MSIRMTSLIGVAVVALVGGFSGAASAENEGPAQAAASVHPDFQPGKARVWNAVVSAAGARIRGTATSASLVGVGTYNVIFPIATGGCVYTATLGTTAFGTAPDGSATAATLAVNPNGVWVNTYNTAGALTSRDFHLVMTCP